MTINDLTRYFFVYKLELIFNCNSYCTSTLIHQVINGIISIERYKRFPASANKMITIH